MRFNSLLKRRSPSASPLRDISITNANSSSCHSLPVHISTANTPSTKFANDANNYGYHNYQSENCSNSNSNGHNYNNGNHGMAMINQGNNDRCSSRCSSMSISSSSSSSLTGAGRGELGQAAQQQQQQQQQQQLVSGELLLMQELQNNQNQQYGHYHYMNNTNSTYNNNTNNYSSNNSSSNISHPHSTNRQHQHQHQHIHQSHLQHDHDLEQYQYDSSNKLYKPFQFTFSSILNFILNNIPCNCVKHNYHYYASMIPSPSQSFDYATNNNNNNNNNSSLSSSSSLHNNNDYYNNKQNYGYSYSYNYNKSQQQQQQEPYHFRRKITYRNTIYFIKRYIQIFTLLLILHLTFVGLYNRMHVPNTCEVADLSIEKLKLMDWIGRDVDYIIHDGKSNSYSQSISTADAVNEVDGDDYSYGTGNDNSGDADGDDDLEGGSESNDPGAMNRRTLKEGRVLKKLNTKSTSSSSHRKNLEKFRTELPKIIHHQWKTDTVPSKYTKWYDQWKVHFPEPEYQHILWTDDSARDLIAEHYTWFLPTYDNYDLNIKRADAARYFILHYNGGIYADLDYEPMINFYDYLPQNQVGLVESPYVYNEKTQNSFMTSPRGDPFWVHVFKGLGVNAHKSVLHATGPSFLDGMMETSKHPVYTLPCENFHRIPYGELKESRWSAVIGREVITRLVPVNKHCGYFKEEDSCQFGKHHNAAGWTTESFLGI
mmetsp:Transcript_7480/g.11397  ORF Transcript_7480/g.11397 Transcript_7480/m.11397 type:complete len:711 (+) Transcript_7480:463-2595(+)